MILLLQPRFIRCMPVVTLFMFLLGYETVSLLSVSGANWMYVILFCAATVNKQQPQDKYATISSINRHVHKTAGLYLQKTLDVAINNIIDSIQSCLCYLYHPIK